MPNVISNDGTRIAWDTAGQGPDLLLVHGTTSERGRWSPVLDALTERYTVHRLDRRGRGGSADAPAYGFVREFEDVAAVAEAIGPDVRVLGHSYGAIAALEASQLTDAITSLILYEPPIAANASAEADDLPDELDALIAGGKSEEALLAFYRRVLKLPDVALDSLRARPNWPVRVALSHTIGRELRASREYRFDANRFAANVPKTLLLLGGDSLPRFRDATALLQQTLPDARTVELPGQQHQAIDTAPGLFAKEVLAFLNSVTESVK